MALLRPFKWANAGFTGQPSPIHLNAGQFFLTFDEPILIVSRVSELGTDHVKRLDQILPPLPGRLTQPNFPVNQQWSLFVSLLKSIKFFEEGPGASLISKNYQGVVRIVSCISVKVPL